MPEPIAELTAVEAAYRGRRVLGPLTLTIRPGDVVGVVGPNGAGKSTLLRLLAGLQRPSRGQLRLFGQSPGESWTMPWRMPAWRRRIGILLQHHEYSTEVPLTVRDVVDFGTLGMASTGHRARRLEAAWRRDEALRHLGLEGLADRLYRELSGGERQKTQMARLLAQGAEMILLDEPAAGLDVEWKERVTRLAAALQRDHHRTVVMVTHEADRLPENCSTVVLMPPGQAPRVGTPEALLQAEPLSAAYGCRVEVVRQGRRVLAFAPMTEDAP